MKTWICRKGEQCHGSKRIGKPRSFEFDKVEQCLMNTYRGSPSFNFLQPFKVQKIQTMANQNNLSLTRQETCIRFGLQASHVVCKGPNNPIQQTQSPHMHILLSCQHCMWTISQVSNIEIINRYNCIFVCLVERTSDQLCIWCAAATSLTHGFLCNAATLAPCTSNSARAENKPKYVGAGAWR